MLVTAVLRIATLLVSMIIVVNNISCVVSDNFHTSNANSSKDGNNVSSNINSSDNVNNCSDKNKMIAVVFRIVTKRY